MKYAWLLLLAPLLPAQEKVDLYTVNRIKAEEFQNSKVMENAFYLADVYGPRLTGSPGLKAAGEWAVRRMTEWGIANPNLEKWGPFGRGWTCVHFSGQQKEPQFTPLVGFARPWSPGTNGPVSGDPIMVSLKTDADLDKFKGKLKGKIVLLEDPAPLVSETEPDLKRFTEAELASEMMAPDPSARSPFANPIPLVPGQPRRPAGQPFDRAAREKFRDKVNQFLVDEGVLVTLTPSYRATSGVVFGAAAGSQDPKKPLPPPSVALEVEQYNRIARLIEKKIPVTLEFDIQNKFLDDTQDSFTVTGELPGTTKKDELVMLGAHLDSWTGGTGATDNGAGSAVVLEALRILKTLDLKMPRTVRLALWTGEEQGLLGSRAYVKEHFADRETMALKPEHGRLSGYFNLDNGTGKIRGVYLQGNDMMRPDLPGLAGSFQGLRRQHRDHPQHRRHRPPVLRCRRPSRLPVHPGPARLRQPDAPFLRRCLRSFTGERSDGGLGDHGCGSLRCRNPRRDAAAQATAQTATASPSRGRARPSLSQWY